MAYSNNIPQPTDRIKSSQNDILQNFISISTLIGIDHVNFDAASGNQGKHNVVSMPNFVGGAASPVAGANEIKLFTKVVGAPAVTQIFVLPSTGEANALDRSERNITFANRTAKGETKLPSGIRLQWGNDQTPAGGLINVAFPSAFATVFGIYLTVEVSVGGTPADAGDGFVRVYQFGVADFDVSGWNYGGALGARQTAALFFRWFAVGI